MICAQAKYCNGMFVEDLRKCPHFLPHDFVPGCHCTCRKFMMKTTCKDYVPFKLEIPKEEFQI